MIGFYYFTMKDQQSASYRVNSPLQRLVGASRVIWFGLNSNPPFLLCVNASFVFTNYQPRQYNASHGLYIIASLKSIKHCLKKGKHMTIYQLMIKGAAIEIFVLI